MPDVIVIGAGHNGLTAACYLARAGLDVEVLEQADKAGGGSRTDELLPGYWFDTHSVAHNIINMTDIPQDLDLAGAGLEYIEMDPFAVAVRRGGEVVRFHRDIDRTVDSIATVSPDDAAAYRRWMDLALPVVDLAVAGLQSGASAARLRSMLPGRGVALAKALRGFGGPVGLAREMLLPYERLLAERLPTELTRGPVAAFAAHASASPRQSGSAIYAMWQGAYHRFGQWHARGGSQALISALEVRLAGWGGRVRTGAEVATIVRAVDGRVRGVALASGERVAAPVVVAAVNPDTALLELLDPPLEGAVAASVEAAGRGNAVQMVVHLGLRSLPEYPGARAIDHVGLQSYVDRVGDLSAGFAAAEARHLPPDPVPTYAFTPSALDHGLAPAGHHTMYLACPCAPYRVDGGWQRHAETFAERMIDQVAQRAPGFRDTIVDFRVRTPEQMAQELRWTGAHPMHVDVTLDQLGFLRPTPTLAGHATPVRGLFISGAGTAPVGGIAAAPGRAAAMAVLRRHGTRRS